MLKYNTYTHIYVCLGELRLIVTAIKGVKGSSSNLKSVKRAAHKRGRINIKTDHEPKHSDAKLYCDVIANITMCFTLWYVLPLILNNK